MDRAEEVVGLPGAEAIRPIDGRRLPEPDQGSLEQWFSVVPLLDRGDVVLRDIEIRERQRAILLRDHHRGRVCRGGGTGPRDDGRARRRLATATAATADQVVD